MYYVYELRDPRNGVAFYVGKGTGDRAYQHQREVVNGTATTNKAKIEKIKEILADRLQVEVAILAEYAFEEDALDHEYHRIASDPTLTNVMPGGIAPGASSKLALADMNYNRALRLRDKLNRVLAETERSFGRSLSRSHKRIVDKMIKQGRVRDSHLPEIEAFLANGDVASFKAKRPNQKFQKDRIERLKTRIIAAEELVQKMQRSLLIERRVAQEKRASLAA